MITSRGRKKETLEQARESAFQYAREVSMKPLTPSHLPTREAVSNLIADLALSRELILLGDRAHNVLGALPGSLKRAVLILRVVLGALPPTPPEPPESEAWTPSEYHFFPPSSD